MEEDAQYDDDKLLLQCGEDMYDSDDSEVPMRLVTRKEWDALPSKAKNTLKTPVKHIWYVYSTGTKTCLTPEDCLTVVKELQNDCMVKKKMTDIPYNFLVGGDGRVYEGRGWHIQPPLSKMFPKCDGKRIDIGYLGSLSRKKLTFKMVKGSLEIVSFGLRNGLISRSFHCKEWASPGTVFNEKYSAKSLYKRLR